MVELALVSGAKRRRRRPPSVSEPHHVGGELTGTVVDVSPKTPEARPQQERVRLPLMRSVPSALGPSASPSLSKVPAVEAFCTREAAPPAPQYPAPSGPRRSATSIDVNKQADGLVVTLQGNGPLKNEYFLVEGKSLVVDIAGASNKVRPMKRKVGDAWVSQIRIGEHEQPKKFTRVVFDLKKVGEHRASTAATTGSWWLSALPRWRSSRSQWSPSAHGRDARSGPCPGRCVTVREACAGRCSSRCPGAAGSRGTGSCRHRAAAPARRSGRQPQHRRQRRRGSRGGGSRWTSRMPGSTTSCA